MRFWGVRGTVPCPGPRTLRYGGNTSCVELVCSGCRIIFDAGSGLRNLGKALDADGGPIARSHLFFSHTHFDHIAGLPFFKPAYDPRNSLELWSGHLQGHRLKDVLHTLMQSPFFPVPLDIMHAYLAFRDFEAGDVLEPDEAVRIRTSRLHHPGGATGYRVESRGRVVCYVTDTEHPERGLDESILRLIDGADLMVYDATYTEEEYGQYRGWGHSTWEQGVRLCRAAGVGKMVAFHHDPEHDDEAMDRIATALDRAHAGSVVAREGMELRL